MLLGKDIAAVDSPIGRLGLTICYDLRFPEIYQQLRFNHDAQVGSDLHIVHLSVWLFFMSLKFLYGICLIGHIGTFSFHPGYWSGTLGDSSSCSCNRDSVLRMESISFFTILFLKSVSLY